MKKKQLRKDSPAVISSPFDTPLPRGVTRDNSKFDGWMNALTNLGVLGKDKRLGAQIGFQILPVATLEAMYQSDDMGSKIIDRPIEEMLREGYDIRVEGVNEADMKAFLMILEGLGVNEKMEWALKMAAVYGGACILMGINDGKSPDQPIDYNSIRGIDYLTVLDRYEITSAGYLDVNMRSLNFGKPVFYRVATIDPTQLGQLIHYSRIIRFEGVSLPRRVSAYFDYWGDSRFNRIYNAIRGYQTGNDSAAAIIQDFTQLILKMKDLSQIISMGKDDILIQRLQLATMTNSILNALVIRDDEEIERKTTNVAGLKDLLDSLSARLVAATDIPHTILLNESAGGLGSTGESEKRDWYDHIKNTQKSQLTPKLNQLINLMMLDKSGMFKGKKKEFTIEYRPLWQQSEEVIVKNRNVQAQTDQIYLQNQVVDQTEIRESRFGSGQYSLDTNIDANSIFEPKEIQSFDKPSGV